jgi:hypothetical protein
MSTITIQEDKTSAIDAMSDVIAALTMLSSRASKAALRLRELGLNAEAKKIAMLGKTADKTSYSAYIVRETVYDLHLTADEKCDRRMNREARLIQYGIERGCHGAVARCMTSLERLRGQFAKTASMSREHVCETYRIDFEAVNKIAYVTECRFTGLQTWEPRE